MANGKKVNKDMRRALAQKLQMQMSNLAMDNAVNKQRADSAIVDSVKQKFVNDKYVRAMQQLTQEKDSLIKKHELDLIQLQKKHAIDRARNQNLPNRKQSGPASTPKRGGGQVK